MSQRRQPSSCYGPRRHQGARPHMRSIGTRCQFVTAFAVLCYTQVSRAQVPDQPPPPPPDAPASPEPMMAPPAPPAMQPPLAGWHGGLFFLRDENDNFRLYLQGRAQVDVYSYFGPGVSDSKQKATIFLRRVRPELSGEFLGRFQWMLAG